MADQSQVEMLRNNPDQWNQWRQEKQIGRPDLSHAQLRDISLYGVDLSGADLTGANLVKASLHHVNLRDSTLDGADLSLSFLFRVNLDGATLSKATIRATHFIMSSLRNAVLTDADLGESNLSRVPLNGAKLNGVVMRGTNFVGADLSDADLSDSHVFGASVWNTTLHNAKQDNLRINNYGEPLLQVDNLAIAQFIYLLLQNENLRGVIDAVANKAVLILGRFADDERKGILELLRDKLRSEGFVPIVFDFEGSKDRNFTETVRLLAGMSTFIIADISAPRSVPLELQAIVPGLMVPLVPIIRKGEEPFSMFADLQRNYDWVMDVLEYGSTEGLLANMVSEIIEPALSKRDELRQTRNAPLKARNI